MSNRASSVHSQVFGYNAARWIVIAVIAAITIWLLLTMSWVAFPMVIVTAIVVLFHIDTRLDQKQQTLKIKALWVPVKTWNLADIKEAAIPQDRLPLERNTFGVHFLAGALSLHAGAANLVLETKGGKTYRVTVDRPQQFVKQLNNAA
ncbi:hypothetical protein [Corynebacterium propinquum]|uniref:PH domain-containing protein n=1 Tax=Corynebacterium propinquum TaxID=43769 RepID=A0ABT7G5N0_9CORY|nr:hypothetical protein [Corynebacterium propinquum]MDK4234449.1 hypothetical protein [Corynebacterium propinquum]MDK4301606.1 hypothetical protein [Corynebacterium propinquum]MDK4313502.1 hypothetical protein [Corynebacterium propinquum]WKS50389.1 hypothetical protein NLL32_05990 [Corynebacterium propinquum]